MSAAVANLWRLDAEQIDLIKTAIARDATDNELALFIQTCNRLQLDPFARQIFLVKRWDTKLGRNVATAQVSIDGFRLIAERTGQYRGQTQPQWCGPELDASGNPRWVNAWLADVPPVAARVGVHREGFVEPLYRVARWSGYSQWTKEGNLQAMWVQYGDIMLSKCAEALALRAAFPHELSGVYTEDEMGDGERIDATPRKPSVARVDPKRAAEPTPAALPKPNEAPRTIEEFMAMETKPRPAMATVEVKGETVAVYDTSSGEVIPANDAKVLRMPTPKPSGNEPVWPSGHHQGKKYTETPRSYIKFMLGSAWAKSASSHQLAWARYAIAWRTEQAQREGRE